MLSPRLSVLSLSFALSVAALGCHESGRSESSLQQSSSVLLEDVSAAWSYRGAIVSAFPRLYPDIPIGEDHDELIQVYHLERDGLLGRIEVYVTNGDCGQSLFFVTDAEQHRFDEDGAPLSFGDDKPLSFHGGRVYYVEKFSSYLEEECGARDYEGRFVKQTRFVDFDSEDVETFIRDKFLDDDGLVKKVFVPMCIDLFQFSGERNCVTVESLGDLGA